MSGLNAELLKILKRIRFRLLLKNVLEKCIMGLLISLAVGLLLVLAARFTPIYEPYHKILWIVAIALLVSIIIAIIKMPSYNDAAKTADKLSLKERAITAIELIDKEDNVANLVKKDAVEKLKQINIKKSIPLTISNKSIILAVGLIFILAISIFIPYDMREVAEKNHKIAVTKKEQVKKVEEEIKRIDDNAKLSDWEKTGIKSKLEELQKEIKLAENEQDLSKALQRAEKKMELTKKEYAMEDMKKISEALMKFNSTKDLAKIIENADSKALKESLKKTADSIKKMNKEDLEKLAKQMEKLAEELKDNPELKTAVSKLANSLAQGSMGDLSQELSNFSDALTSAMANEDFMEAISKLDNELKDMQESLSENSNTNEGNSQDGNSEGQGGKPGSGQGSTSGQGSNQGQGGGQGQGSGAGNGTSMGEENQQPINSSGGGLANKGSSEAKQGQYEEIFTPKNIGGTGEKSQLNGKKNNGGSADNQIADKAPAIEGVSLPYDKVIGEYSERAYGNMEKSNIPSGLKELIKSYFTSLEP